MSRPIRLLCVVAFLLLTAVVPRTDAQILVDTARGLVGQEVQLPVRYNGPALDPERTVTLRGAFKLSNPTAFYPERFVAATGDTLTGLELRRLTDSTYTFSVTVAPIAGQSHARDTLFSLAGEALAGYDSICMVNFSLLTLDETPALDVQGVIITRSIGTPFPYIRYATLEAGYPNPAKRGSSVTFGYRIDKRSPITFFVYDMTGQEVSTTVLPDVQPGVYTESIEVNFSMSSSFYLVRMSTNSGEAYQYLHVIK